MGLLIQVETFVNSETMVADTPKQQIEKHLEQAKDTASKLYGKFQAKLDEIPFLEVNKTIKPVYTLNI